jgi:hypothetical protein
LKARGSPGERARGNSLRWRQNARVADIGLEHDPMRCCPPQCPRCFSQKPKCKTQRPVIHIQAGVQRDCGELVENRRAARDKACDSWLGCRCDAEGSKGWGGRVTAWSQPFGLLPRGTEPAAVFIHGDVPQGDGGSFSRPIKHSWDAAIANCRWQPLVRLR